MLLRPGLTMRLDSSFTICSYSRTTLQSSQLEVAVSEAARAIPPAALDDEVAEALKICGGDAMAALRITLIANAFLEARIDELTAQVSRGFARRKVRKSKTEKH